MRITARHLALLLLFALPARAPAQDRAHPPAMAAKAGVHARSGRSADGRARAPEFVRSAAVLPATSFGSRHERSFIIGGALAGAIASGVLVAGDKGLAPCSTGGSAAFCAGARILVVGAAAGAGALVGLLASHIWP